MFCFSWPLKPECYFFLALIILNQLTLVSCAGYDIVWVFFLAWLGRRFLNDSVLTALSLVFYAPKKLNIRLLLPTFLSQLLRRTQKTFSQWLVMEPQTSLEKREEECSNRALKTLKYLLNAVTTEISFPLLVAYFTHFLLFKSFIKGLLFLEKSHLNPSKPAKKSILSVWCNNSIYIFFN